MIRTDSFVEPEPDVGAEQHWKSVEAAAQYELRHAEAVVAYGRAQADVTAKYRAEFRKLFPSGKLDAYESARRKRLQALKSLKPQLEFDEKGLAALAAARKGAREESLQLLKKLGVNREQVSALQASHADAQEALFWNAHEKLYSKAEQVQRPSRNQDFSPPYAGWYWRYSYSLEGGRAWLYGEPVRYLDSAVGQVGSDIGLLTSDTGESDDLIIDYDTGLQIWYRPPSTGLLTVRVNYVAALTQSSGSTDDEWGYSSVRVTQQAYFAGQVVSPVVGYKGLALISEKKVTTIDYNWSIDWPYAAGATRSMTFVVPSTVVQQGQWLLVRVGLFLHNHIHANDVSADSRLNQQYLIRQVGLTVT